MTTNQILGWIVFFIVVGAVAMGLQKGGWIQNLIAKSPDGKSGGRYGANGQELTCEYIDANGRTVKITGSGTEFENLCKQRRQTDSLVYGNSYYTPYRYYYYPYQYNYYPWSNNFRVQI